MPRHKKRHQYRAAQRAQAKKENAKKRNRGDIKNEKPKKPKLETLPYNFADGPNLGTRFAALPQEIRDEIFACLLVHPVKWDSRHKPDCPLADTEDPFQRLSPRYFLPNEDEDEIDGGNEDQGNEPSACVERHWEAADWRKVVCKYAFRDTWRSRWAPPITNDYVCSYCFDQRFRKDADREPLNEHFMSMPCLCSRNRRSDGLTALLVCRKWYEEGSRVMYTRNTWAFGGPLELESFLQFLPAKHHEHITKISLRNDAPPKMSAVEEVDQFDSVMRDQRQIYIQGWKRAWSCLRGLKKLAELELDAIYLTNPACVRVFRGAALKNLKVLNFKQTVCFSLEACPRGYVFPAIAFSQRIDNSPFAVDVARCIKNLRHGWVRGEKAKTDPGEIGRERRQYKNRFPSPYDVEDLVDLGL